MSDSIAWTEAIPPVPAARIWQVPEGRHAVCILGPWRALYVHWLGKRTYPCEGDKCPTFRHRKPAHWFAYTPCCIPVLSTDSPKKVIAQRPVIIAFNRQQANEVLTHLGHFPGPALTIEKEEGAKHWTIEKITRPKAPGDLPPCPDVLATLYVVWGMIPEQSRSDRPPAPDVSGDSSDGHTY